MSADAEAQMAQRLVTSDASAAKLARAQTLAEGALQRELINGRAAAALASIAALRGDERVAERLFRFSETITRRDLFTQLWLLEAEVGRGDVERALVHYDRAMSVSISSWRLLLPTLANASAERRIAQAVAARLARRPNWWRAFADQFISTNPSPATAFPVVLSALRLNPDDETDRHFLVRATSRLTEIRAYDQAWSLYAAATKQPASTRAMLRNGDFNVSTAVPPFDWQLLDSGGLAAIIQPREDGSPGNALYLSAQAGQSGEVARQLLLLRPGVYVLSGLAGGSGADSESPSLRIACAADKTAITQSPLPTDTAQGRSFSLTFSIPSNCPAQWLLISTNAPLDTTAAPAWIDSLALRRG
jgi:hypothetical protein